MKKLIYGLLVVLAVGLTACQGQPGRDGKDGRDGRDGLINYYNIPVQINQNEWSYTNFDNNNFFYATINMPEITKDIYQHGNMMVYREFDPGTDQATQTPLPYSRHREYLADQATNTWGFYTETVDYEFTVGKMTIFYTASDFDYEIDQSFVPEQMNFRVFIVF
jgi:hypothetical protein